jgi:hypothetical protein
MDANHEQPREPNGRFALLVGQSVRDAVKVEYEADILTLADLGKKYAISPTTIDNWKHRYRWRPRQPRAIDPTDLTSRILEVLSGQIAELEGAMTTGVNEVAMLSKVVRTLDKVLLLKERSVGNKPRTSKRVEELRAKIAERIGELNKD